MRSATSRISTPLNRYSLSLSQSVDSGPASVGRSRTALHTPAPTISRSAQSAEFPEWARAHGYAYSEGFPDSEAQRTRGLAALLPFSDFALQRARNVFYATAGGSARFVLQLTVYGDPHADAPPRGALTVAVAEVPGTKRAGEPDVRRPAQGRGESSVHAHGRWVTSSVSGPLTFASMEIVTAGLDRHLAAA